jgi:hypothetical protein
VTSENSCQSIVFQGVSLEFLVYSDILKNVRIFLVWVVARNIFNDKINDKEEIKEKSAEDINLIVAKINMNQEKHALIAQF